MTNMSQQTTPPTLFNSRSPTTSPAPPQTPTPASSPGNSTTLSTALSTADATRLKNSKYTDRQSFEYIWRSLVAGGIAGCAAKTAVAPLDRVKILFQTNNPHFEKYSGSFFGVFRAARDIRRVYGVRGLFQGHSATLLRIFPYAAIKFMAYEQIKHRIMPTKESQTAFRNMVAGSLAGCTSVFFSYPLDLLRVRLAFEVRSSTKEAVKLTDVVKRTYAEPNPFLSNPPPILRPVAGTMNFYRGFMPTLYGIIPYAGVSFLVYERLKTYARTTLGRYTLTSSPKPQLKWWAYLTCGAVSGAIAQTCSYPLEVIRRNMQVAGLVNEGEKRLTTLQTARHIWHRRGWRGFFVGLSIGYMKVMPMSAVSFFVYEWMKEWLRIE